jgi:hypothetical protein
MLICIAFGVLAPKVYRGVLEDWSFASNQGPGRPPKIWP